jgi:SAM-dependent methyltransferase
MNDDAHAYQLFIGACRKHWAGPMFAAMQSEVTRDFAAQASNEQAPSFEAFIDNHPAHRIFAWFERNLQRLKYSGRWGLAPMLEAERDALVAKLAPAEQAALLTLDPAMPLPSYWLDHDIHNHPGGLADDISAFVYQAAVGSGGVVGRPQIHERFARAALARAGTRAPARVLDLGCGYGRSTVAFATLTPGADVTGIDLSASCLKLATIEVPADLASRVTYRQANAEAPPMPDGAFDLVTSTMLLHELPQIALLSVIAETARLLSPGGVAVHLDFLPPADPLLRVLYDGHSVRNNEPFMRDLARLDLVAAHRDAGFDHVEIVPFAETDGVLDGPPTRWRLPWTMIVATKPERPHRQETQHG